MGNKFWLIQRGEFNNNLETATSFFGGRNECLIEPDYMGAAEFEWGAIPRAFRRILGQFDKYSLHVTELATTGGAPFCIYCRDDRYEAILEGIKEYLAKHYPLKEWSNMHAHFEPVPTDKVAREHRKWALKTNFWWCIDVANASDDTRFANQCGDWIAFTGATDRQNAFLRVINHDYSDWWMEKSEADRQEEFQSAF